MSHGPPRGGRLLLGLLVLLSLVAVAHAAVAADAAGPSADQGVLPSTTPTVAPHPNSTTAIWPYTSRSKSVESVTLPINVVVLADVDLVRSTLIHRPDATWEDQRQGLNGTANSDGSSPREGVEPRLVPTAATATGVYWSEASGSKRYTFIRSGEPGSGRWIEETDQLHDGDYFGTRYHIRFYEVPDGENTWTALQVHREHFDWFRLRHTVGNLPRAQQHVENQFYGQWYVADLHKERFTDAGVLHSDGWATIVDIRYPDVLRQSLGTLALVFGLAVLGLVDGWPSRIDRRRVRDLLENRPIDARHVLLASSIAAIPPFVRLGSLAVERAGVVNSPAVVAAAFYPVLAVGPPIGAYVLARGIDTDAAFVLAAGGLGIGLLADYTYLGIDVLPIELIVHRGVLLVALGLVAAAGSDRPHDRSIRSPTLVAGVSLWILGLLWTLFVW